MLDEITPVLLTYNEAPNIGRTLAHLSWAKDIVVVDSGSTDGTVGLLANYPQVRLFKRAFDTHHNQWCYALYETAIATPWILRLDADYQMTGRLIEEIRRLDPNAPVSAYSIAFDYAIFSHKLFSSLYPAKAVLLRPSKVTVWDKGHTEGWTVEDPVGTLRARIIHDDWKPTESWLGAQGRYMSRELERLRSQRTGLSGWLRLRPPLMPILVFFYCLFAKGLILNGRAGMFYALQRLVAEATLSLMVLEGKLRDEIQSRAVPARDDLDSPI